MTYNNTRYLRCINIDVLERLNELAYIENLPQKQMLEKIINEYTPIPPSIQLETEYKAIKCNDAMIVRKLLPYCVIISIYPNSKVGIDRDTHRAWADNKISQIEYRRKYIERLTKPDAQAELERIRKLKETNNIYVISMGDKKGDDSMCQMFIDYIEGRLIWT